MWTRAVGRALKIDLGKHFIVKINWVCLCGWGGKKAYKCSTWAWIKGNDINTENEKNQVCQCVGTGGRGSNYFRKK